MNTITTHLRSDGKLDLPPTLINKLIHKEIKISYVIKNEKTKKSVQDFIDLIKNGPKIRLKNDNITREWIHERANDEYLYR